MMDKAAWPLLKYHVKNQLVILLTGVKKGMVSSKVPKEEGFFKVNSSDPRPTDLIVVSHPSDIIKSGITAIMRPLPNNPAPLVICSIFFVKGKP